jgi:tol-pal system protein YbgF
MIRTRTFLAGAVIAAVGLTAAPGEAAQWWKFGRDKAQTEDAAPNGGISVAQSEGEGSDRLSRLENSLRNLTGQVEQLTFQLRQLQEQLRRAQADNEFRLQDLESGKPGGGKKAAGAEPPRAEQPPSVASSEEPPAGPPASDEQPVEHLSEGPPAAAGQGDDGVVLGEPPRSIGTLVLQDPPSGNDPIDLSTLGKEPPADPSQTASLRPTGDPATDFRTAYEYTVRGDYDLAEAGFRQFLANYPNDPRAGEAQYWIGDSLFSRGKYGEAAAEFRTAYKKYPQSTKGAETLLKIGMSATATEDFASACKIYTQLLKQYPQASNALRQRVKVEQASAGC